jgi:hypothetical protein
MAAGSRRMMHGAARVFRAYYRSRHGINDATVGASRGQVEPALDCIEREIGFFGHLVDDHFTVADLTAAERRYRGRSAEIAA